MVARDFKFNKGKKRTMVYFGEFWRILANSKNLLEMVQ